MNLEINNSAEFEITIDQETGSYISGKGDGDNIYGDFVASEEYFRNLALIDKKFELKKEEQLFGMEILLLSDEYSGNI